jgi:hypothetical protein
MASKEEVFKTRLEDLKMKYIHGKSLQEVINQPGWITISETFKQRISNFEKEKQSVPLTSYVEGLPIRNAEGTIVGHHSGQTVLVNNIQEEAKVNAYKELLSAIDADIKIGQDAEEELKKYLNPEKKQ